MVRIRILPFALVLFALLVPEGAAADSATRIIVKREPGLTAAERADIRADADVRLVETLSLPRTEVVTAPAAEAAEALRELNADPDVVYAEFDSTRHAFTNDPYYLDLWAFENTGGGAWPFGTPNADMDVPEAWDLSTGAGQTVAVVDTGVQASHPDLAGQVFGGKDWVDDDANPDDLRGHGTHVTGTIVATRDNGEGVAGVAPDAIVVPLRVLNAAGSGLASDAASAFAWAGEHGVRVVNASFGSLVPSTTEEAAIAAQPETLYVVAAGNDNANVDGGSASYPCAYNLPNVLCVGASDPNDERASFTPSGASNYGAVSVDVFAPGFAIVSTYLEAKCALYCYASGTSMAAPHVAATAALLLTRNPGLSVADMKAAIMASADASPPPLNTQSVSGGRANAEAALLAVLNAPTVPPVAVSDIDSDDVPDANDNCVATPNLNQADTDADGVGDACPPDADVDGVMVPFDLCPNQYGTAADGCPVVVPPTPTPTPTPTPIPDSPVSGDRDRDGRADASDACPSEFAVTNDGCPLPAVAALSATAKKCGRGLCASVRVYTNRIATVRVTIERKKCTSGRCRWVRVSRTTTTTTRNLARVTSTRLKRGKYRAVVVLSSSAGRATPVTDGFRVR